MAIVRSNNSITIMKFTNIEKIDIEISLNKDDERIIIMDKDVRFLSNILQQWIQEE